MGEPNGGANGCVIAGGDGNLIVGGESYFDCTISGGAGNRIGGEQDFFGGNTIGGGENNFADGYDLTIAGGYANSIETFGEAFEYKTTGSCIGGGQSNVIALSDWATINGGANNEITNAGWTTVGGGRSNFVSGDYGTIAGGLNNFAGMKAFAAGSGARASMPGAFVWADATGLSYDPHSYPTPGGGTNSFNIRATGGLYFVTAVNAANGQPTSGMYVSAGGSGWNTYSDRNAKTNFASVDGRDVLNRLAAIPILRWNYKTQDPSVQHLGPMAQDFNAAFDLGEGDKSGQKKYIHSLDIDGVALAAIQGLNTELKERDVKIQSLEKDVADLKSMVNALVRTSKAERGE